MKRSMAIKARTWPEFSISLPGPYTAVVNRRLDAIVRNGSLDLQDRFDAFLLRSSWGNFCEFACDRVTKSQEPATPETPIEKVIIKPLGQVDFARILKVSKQRISDVVQLRQDQGLMARRETLGNPGLLVPLFDPEPSRKQKEPAGPVVTWQSFSTVWDSDHPDLIKQVNEAHEAAKPYLTVIESVRRQKLADFKAAQKVPDTADGEKVARIADSAAASPRSPGQKVRGVSDFLSGESRTENAPEAHPEPMDIDIDSRAHVNLKRYKEEVLSSSSEVVTTPADQTTTTEQGTEDWDTVGRAAAQYTVIDDKWIQTLVSKCRKLRSDITPSELAQLIHAKGPLATRKDNPAGFLLTAVPNLCEGESFRRLRQRMKNEAIQQQEAQRRELDRQRSRDATAQRILDDPNASESDKELAREALGIPPIGRAVGDPT